MTTPEVAAAFSALVAQGKEDEATKYWSDDVVSYEAPGVDSPFAVCEGREAVEAKHKWWDENTEVHSAKFEGPFLHGDTFAGIFEIDVTMEGMGRSTMREVALFTVKDGQIVEERFFPLAQSETTTA